MVCPLRKAQALAKFLIEQLEPLASNMSSSSAPAQQEIESLRAQLEADKARNSKDSEGPNLPSAVDCLSNKGTIAICYARRSC